MTTGEIEGEIEKFFQTTELERSLLIGFYGGGNYGDELLLEILLNIFQRKGTKHLQIYHQSPDSYRTFHHDFGYDILDARDKGAFFKKSLQSQNVIIGGGGLWGLDVNWNILLLSILLLIYRYFFRKKVYLIGVGFYTSTGKLGRLSARLAAKAAHAILVRDEESLKNFQAVAKNVRLDKDIAWQLPKLDLAGYQTDLARLEKTMRITSKTLFITLRRFQNHQQNNYTELIEACIANNPDKPIIVSLMEPQDVDPEGYQRILSWQKKYKNVRAFDFAYNPLALYLLMQKHHKHFLVIAPQFHVIITAHLAGCGFMPISYDNKVSALLTQLGIQPLSIKEVESADIQKFIAARYTGKSR